MKIEPSQARFRTAVAMQRLAKALGVELNHQFDDCELLERMATQAERWRALDECAANPSREELPDDRDDDDWKHHSE
jgi:poly(3-hydroxybutyrate) depolymerase